MNARRIATAATLLLASLPALAGGADELQWKHPSGGWTHSGLADAAAAVTYAYPNNLIDRGGQRQRMLIEGKLKRIGTQDRKPPTLIVNGNPMPLYSGDDGSFARPYAFGRARTASRCAAPTARS